MWHLSVDVKLLLRGVNHYLQIFGLWFAVIAGLCGEELPSDTFEFLYINANEDQASGGHTAIRIRDVVFHFQYEEGLLKITRDDWLGFQISYRGYQNRTIYGSTLDLSPQLFEYLRESFHHYYLNERRKLNLLASAQADAELAAKLIKREPIPLQGAAFFQESALNPSSIDFVASDTALPDILVALQQAIVDTYGEGYLQQKIQRNQASITGLLPSVIDSAASNVRQGGNIIPPYAFHERYTDKLILDYALRWLRQPTPVQASKLIYLQSLGDTFKLSAEDVLFVRRIMADLFRRLVAQAGRPSSDWGHSFLLGMARLSALQASIDRGYWVVLNILDSGTANHPVSNNLRRHFKKIKLTLRRDWQSAKQELVDENRWKEALYLNFEGMSNQLYSIGLASAGAGSIQLRHNREVPSGSAVVTPRFIPEVFQRDSGEGIYEAMKISEQVLYALAKQDMDYDLLGRNCVSELFQVINIALAKQLSEQGIVASDETICRAQQRDLGACLDPYPVPFIAAHQVNRYWRLARRTTYASARHTSVAQMYRTDPSLWLLLRESNTLGSSVYFPGDEDSLFLFFTDQTIWSRPVLGALNVVTGVGAAVAGILTAPFDSGETFKRGAKGVFFSLPELAFFNIRKGTNIWIPPSDY